jgi:hypothetical protein
MTLWGCPPSRENRPLDIVNRPLASHGCGSPRVSAALVRASAQAWIGAESSRLGIDVTLRNS